jgi:hypothetical protein
LLGFNDESGQNSIFAVCDRATPFAWRAEPMLGLLRAAAAHGETVYAVSGSRNWHILPQSEVEVAVAAMPEGAGVFVGA